MKDARRWSRLVVYSSAAVYFAFAGRLVGADPPLPAKPPVLTATTPPIPLSILKDIQRVRPGMTRADLDWLFRAQGGIVAIGSNQNTYVYRYGAGGVPALDVHGKPILDSNTHQPVVFGEEIKIDVTFKLGTGYVPRTGTITEERKSSQLSDDNGWPNDVIISVSDPYLGWAIDD